MSDMLKELEALLANIPEKPPLIAPLIAQIQKARRVELRANPDPTASDIFVFEGDKISLLPPELIDERDKGVLWVVAPPANLPELRTMIRSIRGYHD